MSKNRLGKGLGAIFGDDVETVLEDIQRGERSDLQTSQNEIPVNEIRVNPYQPRREFDQEKLDELSESIKQHGLFTPILVRKSIHGYELIAGERRWRATKQAGIEKIHSIVVDFNDEQMMEISLIENIQREDLNVIEEAMAYQQMIDKFGYTQQKIADKVSKSRTHVANLLRLLKLPQPILEMVVNNQLQMGHVRPLITLEDEAEMLVIAQEIIDKDLSVREVEQLIQKSRQEKPKKKLKINQRYQYPVELLSKKLETKVAIQSNKITINFSDDDDLNRILEIIGALEDI